MYRHHCHYNDYRLKSQVFTAGAGPVQWSILGYLVYDKTFCNPIRIIHDTDTGESDQNK